MGIYLPLYCLRLGEANEVAEGKVYIVAEASKIDNNVYLVFMQLRLSHSKR